MTPIDENGTSEISKSGENGLLFDAKLYTVNGNKLSSDPESISQTENGVSIVGKDLSSGQLGTNLITIDGCATGSWSNSDGATGNFSGSFVTTYTK